MRTLLLVITVFLPWPIKKLLLRWLCRAEFGKNSEVGFSFIDTQKLVIRENGRIGSLNIFRHIRSVTIEENAKIGNLNWFTGASSRLQPTKNKIEINSYHSGNLLLKSGGAITSRHYVDLHDDVIIGKMAILAGVRSTLLTHSVNFADNCQRTFPIVISDYVFIGTGCILLPGTTVGDRCAVAAGSVVRGQLDEVWCLYGGQPARKLRNIEKTDLFFLRDEAFVDW